MRHFNQEIVSNVEDSDGILCIDIELPRKQHTCPSCGASTNRIHDYRTQKIKDIPIGRETVLSLHKRRYRCSCGKRFYEKNPFLPRYYRMTSRLISFIFEISPRLADAYRVKNEFLSAIHSASSEEGRKRLSMWIQSVEVMDLPEFSACTTACHNWFQEILNSMDVPWSNGFTEGRNNKTKALKRVSYGIPNFKRQRKRIIFSSS